MSNLIRSKTLVHRPIIQRQKPPIYLIAEGGEVFVLKRLPGASVWLSATEVDFCISASPPSTSGSSERF
ncbi:hypothetical protein [Ferrovum sp.]|uniref:hypothetical protein n=1 Tax=Ferrovum sp. TaxID=2609467 RepID=UPI002632BC72|nr:hypothetical protein [Ferrovum sp.]